MHYNKKSEDKSEGGTLYKRKKSRISRKKVLIAFLALILIFSAFMSIFFIVNYKKPEFFKNRLNDFAGNFTKKPTKKDPDKIKIFLSPASHDPDNVCLYSDDCGESIHANIYVDYLEEILKDCGFQIMRNPKTRKGKDDLYLAVADANEWGADLYYVAHTNAFDEKTQYSLLMVDEDSTLAWANILKKYREKIYPRRVLVRVETGLIELSKPEAPTIYDEIAFHDNEEDVKWFHENIEQIAKNTAQGICEIFGAKFVDRSSSSGEPPTSETTGFSD